MKRTQAQVIGQRRVGKRKGSSKYATKVASGNQMYGPGCCAHTRRTKLNVE